MSYQPKIYRKQGAADLVVASGGTITVESGGSLTLEEGATAYETGETVASTATSLAAVGCSFVTGTTTGPVYTLGAPTVVGQAKEICLTPTSSGATHRAVIYSGSTGRSFGAIDVGNQLTLATSAAHAVRLRAASTTNWRIIGFFPAVPTMSNIST